MRGQLRLLGGAVESDFVTDSITEMWLDFDYERHRFSINNQMGEYLFFVDDPDCPEEVLTAVRDHFAIINPR
jgi:hypothetical protein